MHPDPDKAMTDGDQSIYPEQFDELMRESGRLPPFSGAMCPTGLRSAKKREPQPLPADCRKEKIGGRRITGRFSPREPAVRAGRMQAPSLPAIPGELSRVRLCDEQRIQHRHGARPRAFAAGPRAPGRSDPTGIAANPTKDEVYAVNTGSGTISVIDAEKNRVVATIPVHRKPYFIDVNAAGTRAYVANSGSNNVSVINLDKRREIRVIGVGEGPGVAKISPDGNTLVVTNRISGSVSIVDTKDHLVRSVFAGCPEATDAVILPDSSRRSSPAPAAIT